MECRLRRTGLPRRVAKRGALRWSVSRILASLIECSLIVISALVVSMPNRINLSRFRRLFDRLGCFKPHLRVHCRFRRCSLLGVDGEIDDEAHGLVFRDSANRSAPHGRSQVLAYEAVQRREQAQGVECGKRGLGTSSMSNNPPPCLNKCGPILTNTVTFRHSPAPRVTH